MLPDLERLIIQNPKLFNYKLNIKSIQLSWIRHSPTVSQDFSQKGCQCAKHWHPKKLCLVYWRPLNFNEAWENPGVICGRSQTVCLPIWSHPLHILHSGSVSTMQPLGDLRQFHKIILWVATRFLYRIFRRSKRWRAVGNSIQGAERSKIWLRISLHVSPWASGCRQCDWDQGWRHWESLFSPGWCLDHQSHHKTWDHGRQQELSGNVMSIWDCSNGLPECERHFNCLITLINHCYSTQSCFKFAHLIYFITVWGKFRNSSHFGKSAGCT